jgi:3',5'-nucleoside bisphosphate phosphatase
LFADLHMHTTASDGIKTPSEMIALAKELGFSAAAITDHDTTAGIDEALAAGKQHGLEVIPGIELSTLSGEREIHILGYYVDRHNQQLQQLSAKIIDARQNRAVKMVQKLIDLGIAISLDRVKEIAGSDFIGRPHIARALLEKNYIKDIKEAFTVEYIGRGGRAYVERFKLSPAEGIALLLQAGAVPVLAHPGFLSQGPPMLEEEIIPLIKSGLKGIEVYYSRHSEEQREYYRTLAIRHNLLITGGSDSHGYTDAENRLGSIKLDYKYVLKLKKAKESSASLQL